MAPPASIVRDSVQHSQRVSPDCGTEAAGRALSQDASRTAAAASPEERRQCFAPAGDTHSKFLPSVIVDTAAPEAGKPPDTSKAPEVRNASAGQPNKSPIDRGADDVNKTAAEEIGTGANIFRKTGTALGVAKAVASGVESLAPVAKVVGNVGGQLTGIGKVAQVGAAAAEGGAEEAKKEAIAVGAGTAARYVVGTGVGLLTPEAGGTPGVVAGAAAGVVTEACVRDAQHGENCATKAVGAVADKVGDAIESTVQSAGDSIGKKIDNTINSAYDSVATKVTDTLYDIFVPNIARHMSD